MPSKTSQNKPTTKKEKTNHNSKQIRWTRIFVSIFAVMIILTMVLSSISK